MIENLAPKITPEDMPGARSLLEWSRDRLAAQAGTTRAFVWTYENEGRVMTMFTRERSLVGLAAIRAALEAAGVEFTNGGEPGMKLKRQPE